MSNFRVALGPRTFMNQRRWGVCGVKNYGNNCFVNVVLHVLSCTPRFVGVVDNLLREFDQCADDHTKERLQERIAFLRALHAILMRLQCKLQVVTLVEPLQFLDIMNTRFPHLHTAQQQDAQEAFHLIVEAVRQDMDCVWVQIVNARVSGAKPKRFGGLLPAHPAQNRFHDGGGAAFGDFSSANKCGVTLSNPFEGVLRSHMVCLACGYEKKPNRNTTFLDISVPLPRECLHNVSVTPQLEDCIGAFLHDELSGVRCEGCRNTTNFRQAMRFASLPQLLCIHVNRLVGGLDKRMNRILIPPVLSLANASEPEAIPDSSKKNLHSTYRLRCVVEHLGSSRGGHYQTYRHIEFPAEQAQQHAADKARLDFTVRQRLLQPTPVGFNKGPMFPHQHQPQPRDNNDISNADEPDRPQQQHQWLLISDEDVSRAERNEVLVSVAYMLCYERVSAPHQLLAML